LSSISQSEATKLTENFFSQAFNDLEELLDQNDICIAIKERLTKDSGIALDSSYDHIIKKLVSKQSARGKSIYF